MKFTSSILTALFCFLAAPFLLPIAIAQEPNAAETENDDPYLWLEAVEGEKALNWVRSQNEQGQRALESVPVFGEMYNEAKEILTSEARIPAGQIHHGKVYNFWQDDKNKRGLWRRASVESYKGGKPEWDIVIDYDQLAKDEDKNWIRGATVCLAPEYRHCMVELSDGGKDAGIWREFDTTKKAFVENGFFIPEAKSGLAWFDKDLILVGTDAGEGSLTDSGYSRIIQAWTRGGTLGDAPVIFEGEVADVAAGPIVEHDGDKTHVFIRRMVTFFESTFTHAEGQGAPSVLPWPRNVSFQGVFQGRAIVLLREAWDYQGKSYAQGALIAYHLDTEKVELIEDASSTQSIEDIGLGKSNIVVAYLDNVAGAAARYSVSDGVWSRDEIKMPANGVVSLVSAGGGTDAALLSFESPTTPESLFFIAADNAVSETFKTPAFYDADDIVVEQRFASSSDGEKIPYFLLAKAETLAAGPAPTVQYGYGGFLVPILPVYYSDPGRPQHGALAGKLWVSRGGVLVLSNIRGGSEYGPRWHAAALKENRQLSFDDFIAISEHLVETGVTTPGQLGAIGRSNGGLLMGAIMTQRPDLYTAIDIGVPLFDMKRYNKLLAGASWMGEYGNPDIPEEWAYISKYSPYQNLDADVDYPKVLFYTSTKDDRVHPGHARKAAAKLADMGHDYFYYENIEGGHGGTANQDQLAYRTALEYAYFAHMLMGGEK